MVQTKMSKTVIYSCVTGNYDKLLSAILASRAIPEKDVTYVLYTDQPGVPEKYMSSGSHLAWEIRPPVWKHRLCRRRTARWHKIMSHVLFPEAEHTIWLDGSQRLHAVKASEILLPHLQDNHVATFKHPDRTCVYQELHACRRLKKDNAVLMERQMKAYRTDGYPTFNGLVETACVLRTNRPEQIEFNQLWWKQIKQHSFRDQLSFNYVAWKLGMKYGRVPGCRAKSDFCDFVMHGHG
jgi:hypothetical protein